MKKNYYLVFILFIFILLFQSCSKETADQNWIRNAVIYEINVQNFGPEGNFNSFQKELPRLQKMGVDILWLMPIFPRAEKMKLGLLGSPYAVRDYYGIHAPYGTSNDLKALIKGDTFKENEGDTRLGSQPHRVG